jgi:hypothetical protein
MSTSPNFAFFICAIPFMSCNEKRNQFVQKKSLYFTKNCSLKAFHNLPWSSSLKLSVLRHQPNRSTLTGRNTFYLTQKMWKTKWLTNIYIFGIRALYIVLYLVQYNPVCISNLFYCLIHNPPWFHFIQMFHGMLTINQCNHTIKFTYFETNSSE